MMFYRGKRARRRCTRPVLLLLSLVLMLAIGAGGTLAFLIDTTPEVKNVFEPGEITTTVVEDFDKNTKEYVRIQNNVNSSIAVYIRATWTANWVKDDEIVAPAVQGTDYTVTGLAEQNSGWVKHSDGYYYHTSAVKPGDYTGYLFTKLEPVAAAQPEGAHLEVTILSQAIQAEPDQARIDAGWPTSFN